MSDTLMHYGIKRRSGRYPWGSGGYLLSMIDKLSARGFNEVQVAKSLGMSTTELRNQKSLARAEAREGQRLNVIRQKENGMSVAAISREVGIPPATIRDLLKPNANLKFRIVKKISELLRKMVDKYGFVDIGIGSEVFMGVSRPKLDNAITLLKNQGFKVHKFSTEQLGTQGKKTSIMVLASPDSTYSDVLANKTNIAIPNFFTNDSGKNFFEPDAINNMSSKRVLVRYADAGGEEKDGLIEMRRGVPEFDLGGKAYAQVRIGVDDTHYMKGMAVFKDDIPSGYDIIYNTSQLDTGNPLSAMKEQVSEGASKFGAVVKPNTFTNAKGEEVFGVVNIVGDKTESVEGSWAKWNKTLASQVLSKQSPRLATKQLDIVFENGKAELEEILSLTNPTVRNHLLIEFADKSDRAAVDMKASALPRQTTNVLLPDPNIKPEHIYAPNYPNGETVALVRYPHGGVFEIPTLTVNNKYTEYRDIIGTAAKDAVAIHPDVAKKLSGADFDGDFVLVIPNKNKQLRTEPSIAALQNFDPRAAYPEYPGMVSMSEDQKQRHMGNVSNLITDMTIQGASQQEIARAVKHSMVVIDAAKHNLNYRQSHLDNGIGALKEKYQGSARSGAATLISRAKSQARVPERRDHYTIDPETGEKVFSYTEKVYINRKTGVETAVTTRTTKLAETFANKKDAYDLSSGTVIERVYADYANNMQDLGNRARLATLSAKDTPYSPKARSTYATEVASLDAAYKLALRARPIERKAQLLGNEIYRLKREANPGMSSADMRKEKGRSLVVARTRLDAKKPVIQISPREWEAIEMGAVSPTRLRSILRNSDMDVVRTYTTPRAVRGVLSTGKKNRALALISAGYTTAEVASSLGVSISAVRDIDND